MSLSANVFGSYGYGGYRVVVVASILTLMQALMVGGRLLSRRIQKARIGVDDCILISATVSAFDIIEPSLLLS